MLVIKGEEYLNIIENRVAIMEDGERTELELIFILVQFFLHKLYSFFHQLQQYICMCSIRTWTDVGNKI